MAFLLRLGNRSGGLFPRRRLFRSWCWRYLLDGLFGLHWFWCNRLCHLRFRRPRGLAFGT